MLKTRAKTIKISNGQKLLIRLAALGALVFVLNLGITKFNQIKTEKALDIDVDKLAMYLLKENTAPNLDPQTAPKTMLGWESTAIYRQIAAASINTGQSYTESAVTDLPPAAPAPPPVQAGDISEITISPKSANGYVAGGGVYIKNEAGANFSLEGLLGQKSPVALKNNGVEVLIVHTHGTEAYTPEPGSEYEPSGTDRTLDKNYNVVRVGQEICRVLEENGIKTVHETGIFDNPSYSGSYTRSLEAIGRQMKENPSIKIVIDVHRDSMITSQGVKYKAVTQINGQKAAQIMFVVGTDIGGLPHDSWQQNLSFTAKLQQQIAAKYPDLCRPVNIRKERFNQHATKGSMLLEVGTQANSLDEALYAAQIFAGELAEMLGN